MAAISSAWSRMTGRGAPKKTLPADLQRVTHSGVLDVPKELLEPVVEATKNAEDRPEIMKHIQMCLAESSGKNWRRVYGALVLVEALVKDGAEELFAETAEGRHFDLVQRLSFLEHFDNADKRVTNNVKKKAEALRKEVMILIQKDWSFLAKDNDDIKDTASTCSPGSVSTAARSSVSSGTTVATATGFGSDDLNAGAEVPKHDSGAAKGKMILNNIVSVGHSEDTTDESEGENRAPVRYQEPRRMSAKERHEKSQARRGSSSDTDSGSEDAPAKKESTAPAAPANVDLLGL